MPQATFSRKRSAELYMIGGRSAILRMFRTDGTEVNTTSGTDGIPPNGMCVVRFFNTQGEQIGIQRLLVHNISATNGPFYISLDRQPTGTLSLPSNYDFAVDTGARFIMMDADIREVYIYNNFSSTRTIYTAGHNNYGVHIAGFTFPNP